MFSYRYKPKEIYVLPYPLKVTFYAVSLYCLRDCEQDALRYSGGNSVQEEGSKLYEFPTNLF